MKSASEVSGRVRGQSLTRRNAVDYPLDRVRISICQSVRENELEPRVEGDIGNA